MITEKKCVTCNEVKPATPEYFSVNRYSKGGLQTQCKVCLRRKRMERYYAEKANKPPKPRVGRIAKPRKPAETPLEFALADFLEARKNLAQDTLKGYESSLGAYIKAYPNFPPTAQTITDWLANRKEGELSKWVRFTRMRTFIKWLHKSKRISDNPLEELIRPPKPDELPKAPREKDVAALIAHLESEVERVLQIDPLQSYRIIRDLAIFSLALDSGLRVGEIVNLDLSDIDLDEMSAFVRHSKTKRQRYAMFGKRVKGNLKLWLGIREKLGVPKDMTALFIVERGCWRRGQVYGIENNLTEYCKTLELRKITPHQLRHAYATYSMNNGANIEQIRVQLGHSTILMTARYFMMPTTGRQKSHLKTSPLDNLGRAL